MHGGRAHETSIADINNEALIESVQEHQVTRVIHGHTHRPALNSHSINDGTVERLVLGDWHTDHAIIAVSDCERCELLRWDGSNLTPFKQD